MTSNSKHYLSFCGSGIQEWRRWVVVIQPLPHGGGQDFARYCRRRKACSGLDDRLPGPLVHSALGRKPRFFSPWASLDAAWAPSWQGSHIPWSSKSHSITLLYSVRSQVTKSEPHARGRDLGSTSWSEEHSTICGQNFKSQKFLKGQKVTLQCKV